MKTVVYHIADFDGIFCREIARKFLGDEDVQYIGWNFGDPPLAFDTETLYVMDLPCDRPFGFNLSDIGPLRRIEANENDGVRLYNVTARRLIWIDHHKSSIESHPKDIPGYRIDGVAACRLAWQWFHRGYGGGKGAEDALVNAVSGFLPTDVQFKNREVEEPLAVRLAGEYDIWDHRGDGDLEFQFGLRTKEKLHWELLLSHGPPHPQLGFSPLEGYTRSLIADGKIAMAYAQHVDAGITRDKTFLVEWEGLKFLTLNHARFNSNTFAAKDVPETGHDALLGFSFDGKNWLVSLYHAAHRKDLDLSKIAGKYGGGGHRGAAGMTFTSIPPFLTR